MKGTIGVAVGLLYGLLVRSTTSIPTKNTIIKGLTARDATGCHYGILVGFTALGLTARASGRS